MSANEAGGIVALQPRSLSVEERVVVREVLLTELPHLQRLLEAAKRAADGPDPEASLVFLGMLTTRTTSILFPL
jgi:hypothetical protein